MQISRALIATYLFDTALAGYNVFKANDRTKSSGLNRRNDQKCVNNSDCIGHVSDNPCGNTVPHVPTCFDGECYNVEGDPYAYCTCNFPGHDWIDACSRREPAPIYDWTWCVTYCPGNSTTEGGHSGCDVDTDPCLAP